MKQDNKGKTYVLYKSGGLNYEAEITPVENNSDTVTLVCNFENVEEEIAHEIDTWNEVLQRPEQRVLAFCFINTEEQKYVEIFTYEVIIRLIDLESDPQYEEVEIMDFKTYTEYLKANSED